MQWGMLGYFVGDMVQEHIPVVVGKYGQPDLIRHKHFGAAASSSGGVEMYHIVGVTPEAETLEMAFGKSHPVETFSYGKAEQRQVYDKLNSNASDPNIDYVMLGCPHYSLEQIRDACRLLAGKKVSSNCRLWIFTSRAVRSEADALGFTKVIADAGGLLMTDTCSAFAQAIPPGTKVAALDSAKQTHYLPAILGIQAWFGSTDGLHQRGNRWSMERGTPMTIVLRGRKVVGGRAEGEALVTRETVPGWGGVNPVQGVITETRHELRGQTFKDKVLVFRGAKGSSGWSAMYHIARLAGTAPKALVFNEMTTKVALGAVVMRVPSVTDLDRNPLDIIETGDWVTVDGDSGVVTVRKKTS